jgi:hypothetical protein
MPLYVHPDTVQQRIPSIRQFYADDSECKIAGQKHVLVGALEFDDPNLAIGQVFNCKRALGLSPFQEFKWNSECSEAQRHFITEALLPVLRSCRGFLIVHCKDKQSAAVEIFRQLSDYCRLAGADGFAATLDHNIVSNVRDFDQRIVGLNPGPAGWSDVDSQHNPLIQLADLFVGFSKYRIEFGTGRAKKDKRIDVEFYEGEKSRLEIGYYLFAALRYSLWGKVRPRFGDARRPNHSDPYKHNLGYGLRIFSHLPRQEKLAAVNHLGSEFMGCIH